MRKWIHKFTALTLKRSVSIRLLGTLTALTCRAGPESTVVLSVETGVTDSKTGWVEPRSWLSTYNRWESKDTSIRNVCFRMKDLWERIQLFWQLSCLSTGLYLANFFFFFKGPQCPQMLDLVGSVLIEICKVFSGTWYGSNTLIVAFSWYLCSCVFV